MRNTSKPIKNKKLITIPRLIILALLAMLIIMGIWIFLRSALVKGLIDGIENLESQGYEISHGGLTVEGFPLSLNASSENVSVRAPTSQVPDPAKNWSIKTDRLSLHSATLTPLSWDIRHSGQMRIDMRGARGERYMFDLAPANLDARAVASLDGTLKSAHMTIGGAELDSLVGTPPVIAKFGGANADINIKEGVGHIMAQAEDMRLSPKIPNILDNVLGRKIALAQINANVTNWILLETRGVNVWRAADSHITSDYWAVNWGSADIIGDFDIRFKNTLPNGVITIRIKNPKPLIARLVDTGLVPEKYAATLNGLLAFSETDDDGRKAIKLTVKDGVVKAGFIPLFEF